MATTRRDLIRAAKKLDVDLVGDILVNASYQNVKVVALGLECNPPEWGSCHNESALHAAIQSLPYKEQEKEEKLQKWKDLLHLFLQHGANPNEYYEYRNWKGSGVKTTAFQMVVDRAASDVELLRMFLDAGADPNLPGYRFIASMRSDGQDSYTALLAAVRAGAPMECIAALVNAGADVNARRIYRVDNDYGHNEDREECPLHIAAEKGCVEIASLLLLEGAEVDAEQRYLQQDDTQEDDSENGGRRRYARMKCLKQRALHAAVKATNPELVKLLVLHGADKSSPLIDGERESSVLQLIEETIKETNAKTVLLKALQADGWSPALHKYYPAAFKKAVWTTLLAANRLDWPLDRDLMFRIFSFAAAMRPAVQQSVSDKDGQKASK